jgi:ornithine carbamoyltransferase
MTLMEFSPKSLGTLLALAVRMKKSPGRFNRVLEGQCLAMIFDKSSTRTRVSFDVGMTQLGGKAILLNGSEMQLGRGEPVSDTARVLSRYVQGIMIRTFSHQGVEELAKFSSVPVINGLTDTHHPCQVLADLVTLEDKCGALAKQRVVYIGDGNNIAVSLMEASALLGFALTVITPPGYEPSAEALEATRTLKGGRSGITLSAAIADAAGATAIYTDVWASMGQESEREVRRTAFAAYQVNQALMDAAPGAVFMHCLPAHRGEEVTDEVIDGPRSVVFEQAGNRLYAQMALMAQVFGAAK